MNKKTTNKSWLPFNMNLRQKTLLIVGLASLFLITLAVSSLLTSTDIVTNFALTNQAPSFQHLFGTDWMGRDMFSRTYEGLGLSIMVGAFASLVSAVVAILLGLLSSVNKIVDEIVAGIIDLFSSIPQILLIILVSISFGGGFYGVVMGVGLTSWTPLARILRAEVKKIKTSEYVKLSQHFGKSKMWIATKHILPLIISQIVVGVILMFPHAIMHEAAITFLGFGLPPHQPSIGIILSESVNYLALGYWWLAFYPGISLLIIVLIFDLIGENVQKILDPVDAET
jgi:peptide/nickel transport system permease protein